MSKHIVSDFLEKARYCQSVEELSVVIESIFENLGFPQWAYQTQSDFIFEKSEPIVVHNFPQHWESYYLENNCTEVDPVITYGESETQPFQWSDITKSIELSNKELEYQDIASDHGMNDGLAIPLIGANGRVSMLSLATESPNEELRKLLDTYRDQIVALAFAFHSLAKDLIKDGSYLIHKPELTKREKEVLLWTAKGKSAWDVGCILNISERTVVFHLENAKRKFGVASKYHLIIKAVYDGYIKI